MVFAKELKEKAVIVFLFFNEKERKSTAGIGEEERRERGDNP